MWVAFPTCLITVLLQDRYLGHPWKPSFDKESGSHEVSQLLGVGPWGSQGLQLGWDSWSWSLPAALQR